jgi:hypothetical protein
MARLQLALVAGAWLFVLGSVVRRLARQHPHRHWVAGFETLRAWDRDG